MTYTSGDELTERAARAYKHILERRHPGVTWVRLSPDEIAARARRDAVDTTTRAEQEDGPLEATITPSAPPNGGGTTRELTELKLSALELDATLNRHVDEVWVGKLTDQFNPFALGLFTVWRMDDGTLMTIDGQHRKLAAGAVGYDDPVAAYVYDGLTVRSAAELFLAINAQRNVSAIDKFRKAVQAEHGTEVAVAAMLKSYDLEVGHGPADLGSPNEMVRAYTKLGEEQTRNVIETLNGAFREVKRADALTGEIVGSMTNMLTKYARRSEEIDLDRLRDVLTEATLGGLYLERDTLYKASPQKTKRWHLVNAMIKLYNDAAPRSKKVSPWPYFN